MSAIQEYWLEYHKADEYYGRTHVQCPIVECADGFKVSVQASEFHYCSPRMYVSDGRYSAWELGFPSAADDLIQKYAETPEEPTETVYGWVPTETVDALIEKHGGIKPALAARSAS